MAGTRQTSLRHPDALRPPGLRRLRGDDQAEQKVASTYHEPPPLRQRYSKLKRREINQENMEQLRINLAAEFSMDRCARRGAPADSLRSGRRKPGQRSS